MKFGHVELSPEELADLQTALELYLKDLRRYTRRYQYSTAPLTQKEVDRQRRILIRIDALLNIVVEERLREKK